jgi:translation initiation factor 3 subunit B
MRAQVLELPNRNDKVVDFQWEPRGSRFGVLHGEGPRPNFSLYGMRDMKTSARGVQPIGTQPAKQANCIHWSPQARGRRCSPCMHACMPPHACACDRHMRG